MSLLLPFSLLIAVLTLPSFVHAYYMTCPMNAMSGGFGGGGYGNFQQCSMDTIFYHYQCCDYNLLECCIQLETWFIIFLILLGLSFLLCICCAIGGCVWGFRRTSS